MGGECLNTACVPSKALIAAARATKWPALASRLQQGARRARSSSISGVTGACEGCHLRDRARGFGGTLCRARRRGDQGRGGLHRSERPSRRATSSSRRAASSSLRDRGPSIPQIAGLDAVPYLTNETVFALPERPRHLLVIGAGPVGCELGQAFRRLGSEVTLFDAGRLLPREDEELAGIVRGAFERDACFCAKTSGSQPSP